jgi:hypothetical protein
MADLTFRIGLCATCHHSRTVEARSGSDFRFCSKAKTELSYPKYPPLPVTRCAGYEQSSVFNGSPGNEPLRVRFTAEMVSVIEELPRVPESMLGAGGLPGAAADGVVAELDRDEAGQFVALCQLYISSEPAATGFEDRNRVLRAIVSAINDAQT